jgi:nucleoside 2-deoxyribosyltransferase
LAKAFRERNQSYQGQNGEIMERVNPQCLLITPLGEEYSKIREAIAQMLLDIGVEPTLVENMAPREQIIEMILRSINQADFIIADLTGNNPNVMYEIGYAQALRKPLFLIVQQDSEPLPYDMSGHLFFVYDPSHLEQLQRIVRQWVSRYLARRKELVT